MQQDGPADELFGAGPLDAPIATNRQGQVGGDAGELLRDRVEGVGTASVVDDHGMVRGIGTDQPSRLGHRNVADLVSIANVVSDQSHEIALRHKRVATHRPEDITRESARFVEAIGAVDHRAR